MKISLIGTINRGTFSIESDDYSEIFGHCKIDTRTLKCEDKTLFFYNKRLTYLTGFKIDPDYREKGLGSEAISTIVEQIKNLDTEGIYLTASAKKNTIPVDKLVSLYEKVGFTVYKKHTNDEGLLIYCDMHMLFDQE